MKIISISNKSNKATRHFLIQQVHRELRSKLFGGTVLSGTELFIAIFIAMNCSCKVEINTLKEP